MKKMRVFLSFLLAAFLLLSGCTPVKWPASAPDPVPPEYSGRVLSLADYGAVPGADPSEPFYSALSDASEGDTILFPEGEYPVGGTLYLSGIKNIRISGPGALLLNTAFDMYESAWQDAGFFVLDGCEGVTIEGFAFDYKGHTSIAGTVLSTDTDGEPYFALELFDEFRDITGREHFATAMSFDREGHPDYRLSGSGSDTGAMRAELLYPGVLKVYYNDPAQIGALLPGDAVNIRISLSARPVIQVNACQGIFFSRLTVYSAPGMCFFIAPRSGDITFEEIAVTFREQTDMLMSANADAIHVKGMTGALTVKNCRFEGLGDDALNVHSRAGIVKSTDRDENTLGLLDGWTKEAVGDSWAQPGDEINFYDPETFLLKGSAAAVSARDGQIGFKSLPRDIQDGDIAGNSAFLPRVRISDTVVTNNRARAFLIQSHDVIIENCTLRGISLPAIMLAPDIRVWYEVAPAAFVILRGNTIEKCAFVHNGANLGAITIKSSHDFSDSNCPAGVHREIIIEGNTIKNTANSALFAASVKGLDVKRNRVAGHGTIKNHESGKNAFYFANCEDVSFLGNESDSPLPLFGTANTKVNVK